MNVCPNCKMSYEESKKFCRKCGVPLVPDKLAEPEVIAKMQAYKNRLAKDPGNVPLILEYGNYLTSLSLYEDALIQYFTVLELDQDNDAIRRKIIGIYREQKKWDKAVDQLKALLQATPKNFALLDELAQIYLLSGKKAEAIRIIEQMIELHPQDLNCLIRYRNINAELRKTEETVAACKKILEVEPNDLSTLVTLADILLSKGQQNEAQSAFEKIIALDPQNARANLYVAVAIYNATSETETSEFINIATMLDKALSKKDELSAVEFSMASLFACSARIKAGKSTLDISNTLKGIDLQHLDTTQCAILANALVAISGLERQSGKLDDAIDTLQYSIKTHELPEARKMLADIYNVKGDVAFEKGELSRAIDEFNRALQYQPESQTIHGKLKTATSKVKGKKVIGAMIKIAVAVVIMSVAGYFAYDKLFLQKTFMDKIDRALTENRFFSPAGDNVVDIYKTKRTESPGSPDLKEAAAKIKTKFEQIGNAAFQKLYAESDDTEWDNVINIYNFMSELEPENQETQARMEFAKAHGAIKRGKRDDFIDALARYQKALQLKPNWVLAINGVAKVYVRKNSPYYNKIEALNWYNRACDADPNFPWAYTNLAALYSENQQWDMAEQALQKALNLKKDRPSIFIELGALCEKQNKKAEAIKYYQEAMKYEKNPDKVNWLQTKINNK